MTQFQKNKKINNQHFLVFVSQSLQYHLSPTKETLMFKHVEWNQVITTDHILTTTIW